MLLPASCEFCIVPLFLCSAECPVPGLLAANSVSLHCSCAVLNAGILEVGDGNSAAGQALLRRCLECSGDPVVTSAACVSLAQDMLAHHSPLQAVQVLCQRAVENTPADLIALVSWTTKWRTNYLLTVRRWSSTPIPREPVP